jgi:hypothetical protein
MEGLTDAHNDQYLIVPNKPLEWTGHHQLSATQPQVLCLPLRGSVRSSSLEEARTPDRAGLVLDSWIGWRYGDDCSFLGPVRP